MENINYLRVAITVVAAGLLFSHNIFFARGDTLCQRGLAWENGATGCGGSCRGNVSGVRQYDKKYAADKEKRNGLNDKEKNEKESWKKAEDFCRLKDCIDMSFYGASYSRALLK